jgi:hypothetical protein
VNFPVRKGLLKEAPFFSGFLRLILIFFLKLLPDSSGINDQIEKGFNTPYFSVGLSLSQPFNRPAGRYV